jgi:hypothetical protein
MSDFGTPQPPPRFPEPPPPPFPPGGAGPPWESAGMSLQSFIDTAKGALTDPVATFAQMRREGGLGPPLIYYIVGLVIGTIGSMIWQVIGFGGMGMPFGGPSTGEAMGGMALIVIVPIFGLVGLFLGSLIIHFALGLFGGQKYPYETTFRTMAYAFGSSQPIALIPFCGGFISAIWGLIAAIIGLAQTQETTTGKSAAAVLTPTVICCGLMMIFWGMLFALILGGAAAGSFGR